MKDYYGISLCNDFTSHVVIEIQNIFTSNENHSIGLLNFARQSEVYNFDIPQTLTSAVDVYQHDLPFHALFPTEYGMCRLGNGKDLALKFHAK